jgi:SAM-dependent methyltransferase
MQRALKFLTRDKCPCCGGAQIQIVVDVPFADGEVWKFIDAFYLHRIAKQSLGDARYTIARCDACEAHFQKYILDDEGMTFLYELVIDADASLAKRECAGRSYFDGVLRSARIIDELIPALMVARDVKILDFGMGWGHWAIAANALGFDTIGAELSTARIEFAAVHGIRIASMNDIEDESLDFINTDQVIEHVANPREIVKMLAQRLKPGGVLKIFVPTGDLVAAKVKKNWPIEKNELHPLEHINAFTRRSLDELSSSFGLKRIDPSEYNTRGGRLRARYRDLRWPKRPNGYFRKLAQ